MGMTVHNSSVRVQLSTEKMSPRGSIGGGGSAMNAPVNMGMISQGIFHIIHIEVLCVIRSVDLTGHVILF